MEDMDLEDTFINFLVSDMLFLRMKTFVLIKSNNQTRC